MLHEEATGFSLYSMKDVFDTPCSLAAVLINNTSCMAFSITCFDHCKCIAFKSLFNVCCLLCHVRHVCSGYYSFTLDGISVPIYGHKVCAGYLATTGHKHSMLSQIMDTNQLTSQLFAYLYGSV